METFNGNCLLGEFIRPHHSSIAVLLNCFINHIIILSLPVNVPSLSFYYIYYSICLLTTQFPTFFGENDYTQIILKAKCRYILYIDTPSFSSMFVDVLGSHGMSWINNSNPSQCGCLLLSDRGPRQMVTFGNHRICRLGGILSNYYYLFCRKNINGE